ncbi:OLC1v1025855C1 [Oldenlandia corymbosa var. corymbosa]|uniref:OLC1v1025855C1 n=1 Tax=Oldenlandia corymbosa var. corymbosa TaxID=529605 RepID=A0AAV1C5U0_OLDCO|nr:OLC1v1025855C1 [Oldenlandia corymbosa var. corymbosa]
MATVNYIVEFVITFCIISFTFNNIIAQISEGEAKAFFVFGDSLVDNGNNNFLLTTARADQPPYGIDFPGHQPTGRFSNGYNLPDLIGQYFGIEPILPYLSPELKGDKLPQGANFASAGVGILNDTGIQFVSFTTRRSCDVVNYRSLRLKILLFIPPSFLLNENRPI